VWICQFFGDTLSSLASEAARKAESFGNVAAPRASAKERFGRRKWSRVMSTEMEKQNLAYTFGRAKAGIERGEKGRPVRTIVGRGFRKPVGRFVSLKSGMAMPWESFRELHAIWLSEADSSVEWYLVRPFRIWFRVDGTSKTIDYLPHLERRLSNNRWEVIEIGRSLEEVWRDPHYERKLAKARQLAHVEGFHFRVMTAEEHLTGPALRNAEAIVRDRFTHVTTADMEAFVTAAQRGGAMPFAKAIEVLSHCGDRFDPTARAKLHALIVRRVAGVHIGRPITHDSSVLCIADGEREAG
jgi:hypothetical protein